MKSKNSKSSLLLVLVVLLAAVGLTLVFNPGNVVGKAKDALSGKKGADEESTSEQVSLEIVTTQATTQEETAPEDTIPTATQAVNTSSGDYSCFDNSLFVGNSRVEGLKDYGVLTNCDVYAAVSLNIQSVYTKAAPGRSVPIAEDIKNKTYDMVFILFGDNEIGWPYRDSFLEQYGNFIDHVHDCQPNAKVYIMSVLPISKSASDSNTWGYTNENIGILNGQLRDLAGKHNATFLNPAEVLMDENGALPESESSDGIHFGKSCCVKWADYLKAHI